MPLDFNTSNVAFFAILASVGAFWAQIKNFLTRFFSFFIRTDTISHYDDSRHFLDIVLSKGKIIRWGNTTYKTGPREHIKKFDTVYHFVFTLNDSFLVFIDKTLIIVKGTGSNSIKITYLFGAFNVKKYLELAYLKGLEFDKERLAKNNKRFYVLERGGKALPHERSSQKAESPSFGNSSSPSPYESDDGIFNDYNFLRQNNNYLLINYSDIGQENASAENNNTYYWQKEGIEFKKEVKFWLENKKWYEARKLRWCRGCLLHSSPGKGKSKMVLETARELDVPLYRFDISSMSNEEFRQEYGSVEYGSIVILEDIDSVFNQRENIQQKHLQKQLLTFDGLINTINGVRELSGIFLVVTTNNLGAIDPALLRAGRLDSKIEVGGLDEGGRKFIASNILRDWPDMVDFMVDKYQDISVVEFTNNCMEKAIETFEKENQIN